MEHTNYQPIPALGKDVLTPLFDGFAEVFGVGTAFKKQVVERARLQHGERLLDVGCGTATLLLAAKAQDSSIEAIGIDSDEQVLALAKKKIAANKLKVEVMQARAEKLPFPADSFDIVTSTLIFHHLPTEVKKLAMQEIYRVLKPGGRFLLADFGQLQGVLLKTLFALATLLPSREVQYSRDNQEGKLPLFLAEAGFAVTELGPRHKGIVPFLLAIKK
jgi:ubiquinone/menaquinone biosynthesis C-methylase UbiE